MALDDQDKIAHLLRRAGFAARLEEIAQGVTKGLEATVNDLLNFTNVPDVQPDPNLVSALTLSQRDFQSQQGVFIRGLERWWLNAMVTTGRPLQEKMVLFWHGLFATSAAGVQDVRQMYLQNENFRGNFNPDTGQIVRPNPASPFPIGSFRLIMEYLTKDSAMLFWLNNVENVNTNNKQVGSNENYARELHELFSMGVNDVVTGEPNYTETDVRQASRALTGWTLDLRRVRSNTDGFPRTFFFDSSKHDFGPYDHLGQHGGNNANFMFDNIVKYRHPGQQQSSVGRFLGYRLFKFFGYDNPEPEIINALADVFDGAHGEQPYLINNMLRTIFTPGNIVSEAFYSDNAFKAHVKSPTEYVVSAFRLLNLTGLNAGDVAIRLVTSAMIGMGQYLLFPFDVSGWKEGLNWINTTFDLARFNFANSFLILGPSQGGISTSALRTMLTQNGAQTPTQVVDYFTNLLLQVDVSDETRTNLINYLTAGPDGTPGNFNFNLSSDATIDNKVRGLIHLIMTTPEFQLS
jgi:uncharacterized protein (DUF1800 family)